MRVGFVKNILREVILELKYFEKEEELVFSNSYSQKTNTH